jgi:hypothetical protein
LSDTQEVGGSSPTIPTKTKGGFITSSFLITVPNKVAKFLVYVPTRNIFLLYINSRKVAKSVDKR